MSKATTSISDSTKDYVDMTLQTLAAMVSDENKIAAWSDNDVVRTIVHAMVRYMYCYSVKIIPCSSTSSGPGGKRTCKNFDPNTGEIHCGYVIAMGIHRYLMVSLDPTYNNLITSFGCGFYHDPDKARETVNGIITYMMRKYPEPRYGIWYSGILRMMDYTKKYFISLKNPLGLEYSKFPKPEMRPMTVIAIIEQDKHIMTRLEDRPMIVTNDSIFEMEPPSIEKKQQERAVQQKPVVVDQNEDDTDY